MAGTINDLYLKYVNKVGKTLENDRYFQYLFEMVQAGSTTLQQNHTVAHKQVDERWLGVIEDSLDALNRIIEHPRRFVTSNEEVVPVALARKITADSVRHLSMNTQFIASSKDGDIQPTRVLNVTVEETYDLYENRFIYHLIQRLVTFIDKRTDVIFWSTGDETCNTLRMHSKVDDAYEQIEYKLEMKVKNTQSFAENDSDNMSVFMRIDRVRRMVMALRASSFCGIMKGCAKVRSPIQRTNTIMKDPDYRVCYRLWQFLESYDEVGYTIEERDTPLEFDEEYQIQLFSNLITNYAVFKSLLEADARNINEAPPKRKKVTRPKFIKKVEEEIVTDYNIPDVEIKKVIIEEVTQTQGRRIGGKGAGSFPGTGRNQVIDHEKKLVFENFQRGRHRPDSGVGVRAAQRGAHPGGPGAPGYGLQRVPGAHRQYGAGDPGRLPASGAGKRHGCHSGWRRDLLLLPRPHPGGGGEYPPGGGHSDGKRREGLLHQGRCQRAGGCLSRPGGHGGGQGCACVRRLG